MFRKLLSIRCPFVLGCTFSLLCVSAQSTSGISDVERERFSLVRSIAIDQERMFSGPMAFPPWAHRSIPSGYSYNALGLFCKLDVQFERAFKFPVMFRLGDVRQVNAWEGKGNWRLVP